MVASTIAPGGGRLRESPTTPRRHRRRREAAISPTQPRLHISRRSRRATSSLDARLLLLRHTRGCARALTGRCGPGSHAALVQGWRASAPAPTCSTAVLDRNALVSVQERPNGRVSRPCRFILVARLGPRKAGFYIAPNASPFAKS